MGYGYGVWLIIEDENWVKTTHVPHITIACYMTYQDAYAFYSDILDIMMSSNFEINIIDKIVDFDKDMYPDDDNDLAAWGYNVDCDYWDIFKAISIVYNCNFSFQPHTTVEYGKDNAFLTKKNAPLSKVKCKLAVAKITDDNPDLWRKI